MGKNCSSWVMPFVMGEPMVVPRTLLVLLYSRLVKDVVVSSKEPTGRCGENGVSVVDGVRLSFGGRWCVTPSEFRNKIAARK